MPQNLLSLMALYIVPDRSSHFIRIQSCAQDVFIDALLKIRCDASGKSGRQDDDRSAEKGRRACNVFKTQLLRSYDRLVTVIPRITAIHTSKHAPSSRIILPRLKRQTSHLYVLIGMPRLKISHANHTGTSFTYGTRYKRRMPHTYLPDTQGTSEPGSLRKPCSATSGNTAVIPDSYIPYE